MMIHRRDFLKASVGAIASSTLAVASESPSPALIAITLDLEMARNFPRWEETGWDYEKGNLNQESKDYTLEAARRVKQAGGRLHTFAVGQTFEQENVDWMKQLIHEGHAIGNHTYDHVYLLAKDLPDLQYRFQRAPWLLEGRDVASALRENIRRCTQAMETRLGIKPAGFRTPGGFAQGLTGREDLQRMLLDLGFTWASCQYPAHPIGEPMKRPASATIDGIIEAQKGAQPRRYPTGLLEIPMSPISDIGAFRNGRWELSWFLEAIGAVLDHCIAGGQCFDFLAHPSCLYVVDPKFQAIDLICRKVVNAGPKAAIVTLDRFAERAR
ncbi:polysaccharide deacetylase family protein [bacterium]|nr:polysaccharide deacetylase family protein [bacterium]